MNERYLFRGKRVDNGGWTEGFLVHTGDFPNGDENDSFLRNYWVITNGYTQHEVEPHTIGQCTSLDGVNDGGEKKMIFEGDILLWHKRDLRNPRTLTAVVMWNGNGYSVRIDENNSWSLCAVQDCKPEIIGNIHDNPELLKGADNSEKEADQFAVDCHAYITDTYRKSESEGRLIELPCKVGDTMYIPWHTEDRHGISTPTVSGFVIGKDGAGNGVLVELYFGSTDKGETYEYYSADAFGDDVFTTRKAAEDALIGSIKERISEQLGSNKSSLNIKR
jgi:hypothetical protein